MTAKLTSPTITIMDNMHKMCEKAMESEDKEIQDMMGTGMM